MARHSPFRLLHWRRLGLTTLHAEALIDAVSRPGWCSVARVAEDRQRRLVRRKSLRNPDDTRQFAHGAGGVVRVGGMDVGRAVLHPGWRWSLDVKPLVHTPSCQTHHLHVVVSGRFAVQMDDGSLHEFEADDVVDVPPGHDAWVIGDEPAVIFDISGNSADFAVPLAPARAVATILMSDIVRSTETAAKLGDRAWRPVLGEHDRAVRRELDRFRGREVKTTGDGFLATFDSAGAALLCAVSVRDQLVSTETPVRVGVHTGEIEIMEGDIRGLAVHATARVMAAAGASEVFTSAITRLLAEGTAVEFEARGRHELKGLPESVELFSVHRMGAEP